MAKLRFKIPPPNHLVTFEAAGRCLNFTKAAKELNVSRVSVSQQIKALENYLGVPLFVRLHRSLQLTKAGEQYFTTVSHSFSEILKATYLVQKKGSDDNLTVTVTTGFSTYWLLPRIGEFREKHPGIDLRFLISDLYINFDQEDVDLAIRYGEGHWDGLNSQFLLREEIFPCCSTKYFVGQKNFTSAKDLLSEPLIHLEGAYDHQTSWKHWFDVQGVDVTKLPPGIFVNTYTNLVQAVMAGQGLALIGPPLVEQFLDDKNLICPIKCKPITRRAFYLVSPEVRPLSIAANYFAEWICEEAKMSRYSAQA